MQMNSTFLIKARYKYTEYKQFACMECDFKYHTTYKSIICSVCKVEHLVRHTGEKTYISLYTAIHSEEDPIFRKIYDIVIISRRICSMHMLMLCFYGFNSYFKYSIIVNSNNMFYNWIFFNVLTKVCLFIRLIYIFLIILKWIWTVS